MITFNDKNGKLSVFKKEVRLNFTNFHEISSKIVSFQGRNAPQFHQFSSKFVHFQIRNFVRNGQISNKERGVPGRVADSLFRPHPEQRARASREPSFVAKFQEI